MGIEIKIGNAVAKSHERDFPVLYAAWEVEYEPGDAGDAFSSNTLIQSHTVWAAFLKTVGLSDLFGELCDEYRRPGCRGLTHSDVVIVKAATARFLVRTKPAANHEGMLTQLQWLEKWMEWALKNCETPAIEYSG